ncbi:molybdopterin-dependent oxidoreductase [Sphingobium fluviale]|jgi:DMSO/TMAO reductase YedYZ molybdopterin-dependent catalytic subunit|uniref:Molybdopterin-binding protein n=1 Tax=Sphingobium fluviale TaxID=2506423 RepID=A0A4Q1KPF7_9SPHN|nr:molybdopterin-dependent oxidoreductase [Sphingobium fluviale]RXR30774.1 molybdopterin-binding protein [Sphingobium fluviale]
MSDPDTPYILREAAKRLDLPTRRLFLRNALGLGTLGLLGGCKVIDGLSAEQMLSGMNDFNDRAQAWLFNPSALAREYPESAITRPFPFNSFYTPNSPDLAPVIEAAGWVLNVTGQVERTADWTLPQLYALPQFTQITRHICIEGWSAIGKWGGVRLSHFLKVVGADTRAKYVTFRCDDEYVTSIDMATALHPQTQLCLWMDGRILERRHGFPLKLRVPTKLGFKNAKHVGEIEVGNDYTGGYWETYGYNWYSGL